MCADTLCVFYSYAHMCVCFVCLQLFCCFSATFTLNFLNSAVNDGSHIGYLGSPGLVDFGVFDKVGL